MQFKPWAISLSVMMVLGALTTTAQAEKLNVVASFSIIGDMAANVGGERIALKTLVGPDSDAHVYQPKPSDAIAAQRANVILVNGLGLEGYLTRLLEMSESKAQVVELSKGANIIKDPAGGHYHFYEGKAVFHAALYDPHAWQSVANAKVYVTNIKNAFCQADAEGCAEYTRNAQQYTDRLTGLDNALKASVSAIPAEKRTVVVGHNAFHYFENDYGIKFLSPQGISTEAEASAADVAGIVKAIRQQHASAIFSENISDAKLVTQIAAEVGLKVAGTLYTDALSARNGPAAGYIELMQHNMDTISHAVK